MEGYKKVEGAKTNLLLAKAKTISELRKMKKEIISKIREIKQIFPSITEWTPEELYTYLDQCKKSNKYTYTLFKILAFKEKPITKEQLIKEMSQQLQKQITPKHLTGIKAGLTMTTDKLNKEYPIQYTEQHYQIKNKYKPIIQQYFKTTTN